MCVCVCVRACVYIYIYIYIYIYASIYINYLYTVYISVATPALVLLVLSPSNGYHEYGNKMPTVNVYFHAILSFTNIDCKSVIAATNSGSSY